MAKSKPKYVVLVPYIRGKKLMPGDDLDLTPEEAEPLLNAKPPIIKLKESPKRDPL